MKEKFNTYTETRPRLRKIAGWFLVVFGFFMLVTPLTPGGMLFFVGLEILGLRFALSNVFMSVSERFSKKIDVPKTVAVTNIEEGAH